MNDKRTNDLLEGIVDELKRLNTLGEAFYRLLEEEAYDLKDLLREDREWDDA